MATLQPHGVAIIDHGPVSSHVAFAVDSIEDSDDKLFQIRSPQFLHGASNKPLTYI